MDRLTEWAEKNVDMTASLVIAVFAGALVWGMAMVSPIICAVLVAYVVYQKVRDPEDAGR